MRRVIAACLLLGACATTASTAAPPERLAGCWVNRDTLAAVTMRWLPHRERPGVLSGSRIDYSQAGGARSTRYTLEPSEVGWSMCELDSAGAATRCWQVAEGEGGSLEGGRVFIDTHGDRLRITIIGDGPDRIVFHGRRDGCD
jgi:hypothetical protein